MAEVHGSKTVIKLDDNDLSQYCDTSEINRDRDTHDKTGYGSETHKNSAGLKVLGITIGGWYDSTTGTGPRAVIEPLWDSGATVTFVRQIEGTGAGLPQDSVSVFVKSYVETAPVADIVRWTAELTNTGDIDSTAQSS